MSCSQIEILSNEEEILQLRKELVHARWEANLYKSHYLRNVSIRERIQQEHEAALEQLKQKHQAEIDQLEKTIKKLEAKVKLRERQLFGKKSEQGSDGSESADKEKPTRGRGQQCGKPSPAKRKYSHLPVIPEIQDIPEGERICPCCNTPYTDMGATEDSDIIEVEVQAHIRRLKRKKYRRTCNCRSQPAILTAPQTPKVLSKSHLGNSVWVYLLIHKFWHGQPLHRIMQELSSYHLPIPAG